MPAGATSAAQLPQARASDSRWVSLSDISACHTNNVRFKCKPRASLKSEGSRRCSRLLARANAEDTEEDEIDFAVLRMTLGIPGFDETQLPRVVAVLCVLLAFANHQASSGATTQAQTGAEAIVAVLATAAAALPLLGSRLREAQAGRSQAENDPSALKGTQLFAISPSLTDAARQDLAWASYSLLRNTGSCSLIVCSPGLAWLVRGLVQGVSSASLNALPELVQVIDNSLYAKPHMYSLEGQHKSSIYLPDRRSIAQATSAWSFLPAGIQTLLLQQVQPFSEGSSASTDLSDERPQRSAFQTANSGNGAMAVHDADRVADNVSNAWLILAAGRPRGLSRRERLWAAAIAAKLHASLRTGQDRCMKC